MNRIPPRQSKQPVTALRNADDTPHTGTALCAACHADKWARRRAQETPGYVAIGLPIETVCAPGTAQCRECGEVAR